MFDYFTILLFTLITDPQLLNGSVPCMYACMYMLKENSCFTWSDDGFYSTHLPWRST